MEHETEQDHEKNIHPIELLSAFALQILEPAEETAVQAHLDGCPTCRAELAALVEMTNLLSLAVPQMDTPEGLRERLLEYARQKPKTADRERHWQRPGRALSRFTMPSIWRPAAAVFILLLLVSNLYFLARLQQIEKQAPANEQSINLGATDAAPNANGLILIREGDPTGTLVVNGLPDLGPEQQYQLWLVKDEVRVSGAVFSVSEEGFTSVPVTAPEALPLYTRFGITIEPAGGSPGPTGDGVLRYALPEPDEG